MAIEIARRLLAGASDLDASYGARQADGKLHAGRAGLRELGERDSSRSQLHMASVVGSRVEIGVFARLSRKPVGALGMTRPLVMRGAGCAGAFGGTVRVLLGGPRRASRRHGRRRGLADRRVSRCKGRGDACASAAGEHAAKPRAETFECDPMHARDQGETTAASRWLRQDADAKQTFLRLRSKRRHARAETQAPGAPTMTAWVHSTRPRTSRWCTAPAARLARRPG